MAENNELKIIISAQVEELSKKLKDAEKQIESFSSNTKKSIKESGSSTADLAKGFKVSSEAMNELDSHTYGLGSSLLNVAKAAKISGAAMRTALISTGVGALVVALGLVIAHWDDIVKYVDKYGEELREANRQLDLLSRGTSILDQQLKLLNAQKKLAEIRGDSTADLIEDEKKLLAIKGLQLATTFKETSAKLKLLQSAALELTLAEKALNLARIAAGIKPLVLSEVTDEEVKNIRNLQDSLADLKVAIVDNASAYNALFGDARKKEKSTSTKKKKVSELTGLPEPSDVFAFSERSKEAFKAIEDSYVNSKNEIEALDGISLRLLDEDAIAKLAADEEAFKEHTKRMQLYLEAFNEAASYIINDGISNAFAGIGESIGAALAEGGNILEAAGASLLSALGGVLTEMGKMAIEVGVGLLAIKLALDTLNPVLAIAAGIALVALGSFFSSKASSIGGSMGGGGGGGSVSSPNTSFSGSSYSSGVAGNGSSYSSSRATNNSGGSGGGTYVFEIEGTKLVGVLSNTLARNRTLGGNLSLT